MGSDPGTSPLGPRPWTTRVSTSCSSTSTPSARTAASVDSVSPLRPHWRTSTSVSQSAPIRSERCEIDLSPGTAMWPSSRARGSTLINHRRDEDVIALALEQLGGAARVLLARDEQRQGAAALGREMLELEVLDVDPLGAECLRDPLQNARPVGDVHAHLVQRARVVVGDVEHAAAVLRRLADPAREKPRIALGKRGLDLLDPAAVLGERLA